jgi:ABC-type uncharacterized transport system substrate-binding protein
MTPIVFVTASDPIGSGFVADLPRPGGNLTGSFLHRNLLRRTKLEVETQLTVIDSLVPFCNLRLRLFDFPKFLCATFAASH